MFRPGTAPRYPTLKCQRKTLDRHYRISLSNSAWRQTYNAPHPNTMWLLKPHCFSCRQDVEKVIKPIHRQILAVQKTCASSAQPCTHTHTQQNVHIRSYTNATWQEHFKIFELKVVVWNFKKSEEIKNFLLERCLVECD